MSRLLSAALEAGAAVLFSAALAVLLTWPVALHLDEIIIGGGELGGWLWRQWWHFQEVRALAGEDLGLWGELQALVGLGRFPETGNILDILLLSYPLQAWLGAAGAAHNVKVLAILIGNGLCGYALARSFTDSRLVALAAASLAIFNPLVIQDINKTGLRQVILWWLLLFPVFLNRAGRTLRPLDGALVGINFALISAFYWFYGLFAAMMGAIWLGAWWLRERPPLRQAGRWLLPAAAAAGVGVLLFVAPYLSAGAEADAGCPIAIAYLIKWNML